MDSPILIKNKFNNGFLTFEKIGIEANKSNKSNYLLKCRNWIG